MQEPTLGQRLLPLGLGRWTHQALLEIRSRRPAM
jgi:hypothetical protein